MNRKAACLAVVTLWSCASGTFGQNSKKGEAPTLEQAFRAWHKGLSSKEKQEQIDALRSMLPAKKDIEYLFPKHADKLWPQMEKANQLLVDNVGKLAAEFTKGGDIRKVEVIDARKEEKYQRILAVIPQDVIVCRAFVEREQRASGSSTFLFVGDRWIWIRGLEGMAEYLEKLK